MMQIVEHASQTAPQANVDYAGNRQKNRPAGRASLLLIAIPLVILLVGCLATYAVYGELLRRAEDLWREGAQNQTERLDAAFADALRATQVPLRAITGLFLGSETVTRVEFERAVAALARNDLAPGDISIAHLLADEGGDYYMPFGIGLERYGKVSRDPVNWSGLESAVALAAQQPQHLLLSPHPMFEDDIGPRFALVVALATGDSPPLLVAPLNLEEILANFVAANVPPGLHLSVSHGALIESELYPIAYRPLPAQPGFNMLDQFQVAAMQTLASRIVYAGAEWQLTWAVAPTYQGGPNRNLANAVLIGGLCFSVLCALLFLLARHEIKRERALSATAKQAADMFRQHMVQLSLARDAAEQANRAKSQFLANMSHELRTPLNAIIGFSDMMKLGIGGRVENERHLECVKHISDSGTLLFKLIDQLFDTAKIESGQLELTEEPHDAVALAREAIALVQPVANTKQIRLTLEAGADLPAWLVDYRAALQILNNLLTNAVKFSGRDTVVETRLQSMADGGLMIAVIDQGPGIAPEILPRIFDRFSRGDPMVSGKEEGLGLGLWIVRNLVEMHRGGISVESVVGQGTTIRMRFPPPASVRSAIDPATIPAD
ncbi:MAG: HAMP domain-containing histidine kinase [Rhodospirillaceae bacterium]|nr:HAMP domain-containing histidine kinase [Rhodospirillaceae bacterium]